MELKQKVFGLIDNFKVFWKIPPKGRYMSFKEIASYAGGGIGAYFIIQLGSTLLVSSTNMIVGNGIGIDFKDMYVLYLIATLANIPLTAIRANMIDNTRGKGGKYRPYLLKMGIPTALIASAYVWFPYDIFKTMLHGELLGRDLSYIVTCALVLVWNLLLMFYFNFFNDAYTNLIHVLSPNTQERTDVLAIKSVVYSLAPSIINIALPTIAGLVANNNLYDIKVYRYSYPVFAVIGIALTIIVYVNTQEKIVQAKTHTIQISFIDSFKAVAKNKYFWIIALAGWLGFLEQAYGSILDWTFSYGHACSGPTMSIIRTVISNASLWGMILAPICVRKFGKKATLIGINMMNIVCILAMGLKVDNIIWLAFCVYLNWFFGAFEQITTPAIQADIRDYHQYKTGERVDGMFATVTTIGNIVTLATSLVLPLVYDHYNIKVGNGYENYMDILDTEIGQPGLLHKIVLALVFMAAVGAFMNVVPYFFYDLKEREQKSIVQILKIRAMFEDYGNGILNDANLIETVDIIRNTREMAVAEPKNLDKNSYKSITDKAERKMAKKQYNEAKIYNEDIEIAKIVNGELNKFNSEVYSFQYNTYKAIYAAGLNGILSLDIDGVKQELAAAKIMPTGSKEEKELRSFCIELAHKKMTACKTIKKYYSNPGSLVAPDMTVLEGLFHEEDECDEKLKTLNNKILEIKKSKSGEDVTELKVKVAEISVRRKTVRNLQKEEMDKHAQFNKAAKPYLDAGRVIVQAENYTHLEEIIALYDEAKIRNEAKEAAEAAERARIEQEEKEYKEKLKAEKKNNKKNK